MSDFGIMWTVECLCIFAIPYILTFLDYFKGDNLDG